VKFLKVCVVRVLAGDSEAEFVKIDLNQPWLRQASGLTVAEVRLLSRRDTVVTRLKQKLKDRRSVKRSRLFRTLVQGGVVSETVCVDIDHMQITLANSLNSLSMLCTKDSLEWFMAEFHKDVTSLFQCLEDGSDLVTQRLHEAQVQGAVLDDDDDEDADPEMQHYEALAAEVKESKDARVHHKCLIVVVTHPYHATNNGHTCRSPSYRLRLISSPHLLVIRMGSMVSTSHPPALPGSSSRAPS
jgi:hypothetical protein